MKCLKQPCKRHFYCQIRKIEYSFGPLSELDNLLIIKDTIVNDQSTSDSNKAKTIFKYFFTLYLLKASEDEIYMLCKHITGEKYELGYRGILIKFMVFESTHPVNFINAHTCFKSLDLNIHVSQLEHILLNFTAFKEAINSQFSGLAYNDS